MIVPFATFLETRQRRQRALSELHSTAIDVAPIDDPANAPEPQHATRVAVAIQGRPSPVEKC
jgi:hypothetical protein